MLIGFILTGALTFVFSSLLFIGKRIEEQDPEARRPRRPVKAKDRWSFCSDNFPDVVLQLSDQQLVVGLLLLVCAYVKYWKASVGHGQNDLWIANDIVCFSMFTHAATLLSLRDYFREHRYLAISRVVMMYTVYILWFVVAVVILIPKEPNDSPKDSQAGSNFWHWATGIEIVGIMWIYIQACLQVFTSDKETEAKPASRESGRSINTPASGGERETGSGLCLKMYLRWFAVGDPVIGLSLGSLWAFSLGALTYSLVQAHLTSSWGFGQLLPTFMVLLPFQSLITAVASMLLPPFHHFLSCNRFR